MVADGGKLLGTGGLILLICNNRFIYLHQVKICSKKLHEQLSPQDCKVTVGQKQFRS